MKNEVTLPKFGELMEDAVITCWLVEEGEEVKAGSVLCEISADKATLEVEAPVAGILGRIIAPENACVSIGETVAIIVSEKGEAATDTPVKPKADKTFSEGFSPKEVMRTSGFEANGEKAATPEAKTLAESLQVPLVAVGGNGPCGKVTESDVQTYADSVKGLEFEDDAREICVKRGVDMRVFLDEENGGTVSAQMAKEATPFPVGEIIPLNPMRSVIARRMCSSTRTAPHFFVTTIVDMSKASEFRQKLRKEKRKVSFNDMIIRACGLALAKYPQVAAALTPDGYMPRGNMNVGFAVSIGDDGLIVPVIRDVDRKPLEQVALEAKELVQKARSKKMPPDDYSGGVFTVSNLGMFDVDQFTAIINPGEASILAIGKIYDGPYVVSGELIVRPQMKITLSSDHRIIDGVLASKFNAAIKNMLECPEKLL